MAKKTRRKPPTIKKVVRKAKAGLTVRTATRAISRFAKKLERIVLG